MINWLKCLLTFPKWKIVKEKDQFKNSRYRALAKYGVFGMWWHLQWINDEKRFACIEFSEKYLDSYEEAEKLIISDQNWKKEELETQIRLAKQAITKPKFKTVLTVKY